MAAHLLVAESSIGSMGGRSSSKSGRSSVEGSSMARPALIIVGSVCSGARVGSGFVLLLAVIRFMVLLLWERSATRSSCLCSIRFPSFVRSSGKRPSQDSTGRSVGAATKTAALTAKAVKPSGKSQIVKEKSVESARPSIPAADTEKFVEELLDRASALLLSEAS
ncbi:hypothetical protein F3Y22_tig00111128pilonHSYRG00016 [Hibiscus syriacus]|uniref:Uncharacterized protein n=1 Tax=Hibiscus syriacus TaxID=106335 RepID=A0A6A2YYM5_HIBSY|nr:hypothetical protein F3Y22_tig00111128pilonHSYRG00016 [Hibiscus syriacus]